MRAPRRHQAGRRTSRWLASLAFVAAGGIALAACGGSGTSSSGTVTSTTSRSSSTTANPSGSTTIVIRNFAFQPDLDTVAPGEKITVVNHDSVAHTLTSTTGQFDTGMVMPNQSKAITAPTKPGTYHYRCTVHPFMTGTLTVR